LHNHLNIMLKTDFWSCFCLLLFDTPSPPSARKPVSRPISHLIYKNLNVRKALMKKELSFCLKIISQIDWAKFGREDYF